MTGELEKTMRNYAEAYHQLYKRMPSDLRAVDSEWVIVNGAHMRVSELEYLTKQLQIEYDQTLNRKNVIHRLIKWFKG